MRKTLNKYITAHDYANRILFVLSGESSGVSLYSLTTASLTPIGVASASISLLFLTSNGIVKMLFKAMRKKKTKAKKNALLYRSNLISTEKIISNFRLKESVRAKEDQLSDIEQNNIVVIILFEVQKEYRE